MSISTLNLNIAAAEYVVRGYDDEGNEVAKSFKRHETFTYPTTGPYTLLEGIIHREIQTMVNNDKELLNELLLLGAARISITFI